MTTKTLPTTDSKSRQAVAAETASKPKQVTGKLKVACDAMVYGVDGGPALDYAAAALHAKITVRSMRLALTKQWVRAYLQEAKATCLASASATNLSRIIELRDGAGNSMTRLQAAKAIEEMVAKRPGAGGAGAPTIPGLLIVVTGVTPTRSAEDLGDVIEVNRVEGT